MATGAAAFSDVRHQDRAISILRRALRSGRTHHAYLFAGPEGVGKELAARALASRLLCLNADLPPDADACGQCASCRMLASGNHPDFHLIHRGLHQQHPDRTVRASKGLFLGVDLIRHFLIEPSAVKPMQGRRRVFLIRDAERMNEEAQNALLKTLEEPPGAACLILVSSSASRLLPTIRSRSQHVPFGLLPTEFVRTELTRRKIPPQAAAALAHLSDGRLGAALRWHAIDLLAALEQIADLLAKNAAEHPESFAKAMLEISGGLAERAAKAETAAASSPEPEDDDSEPDAAPPDDDSDAARGKLGTDEQRNGLKLALMLIAAVLREALVSQQTGTGTGTATLPQAAQAAALCRDMPADQLDAAISGIAEAERMIDRNVALQLVCERLATIMTGAVSPSFF